MSTTRVFHCNIALLYVCCYIATLSYSMTVAIWSTTRVFLCNIVLLHVCCDIAKLSYSMTVAIWSTTRVFHCNIDLLHVSVVILQHCHIGGSGWGIMMSE